MTRINLNSGGYQLGGYREIAVPRPLRSIAEVAWVYAAVPDEAPGSASPPVHRVIPETGVSLCFASRRDRHGRTDDARLCVMGPIRTVRFFAPEPGTHLEAIRLKPEYSRPVLGVDPAEFDDVVEGDAVAISDRTTRLRDRLARTTRSPDAFAILLQFLEERATARRACRPTAAIHALLEYIRRHPASPPRIHEFASTVGSSERHIRRLSQELTGRSTKYFHRIRRLQHAVSLADTACTTDWTGVAIASGYYDQAHMINEFRALTGTSPSRLRAERRGQWGGEGAPAMSGFSNTG
jgi:AraC-like DNA-binding protein